MEHLVVTGGGPLEGGQDPLHRAQGQAALAAQQLADRGFRDFIDEDEAAWAAPTRRALPDDDTPVVAEVTARRVSGEVSPDGAAASAAQSPSSSQRARSRWHSALSATRTVVSAARSPRSSREDVQSPRSEARGT